MLQSRALAAKGTVVQAGTDGSVAIRLRKIGTETATSVTVTTGVNIVLVGSTTTDTITFATYDTIGKVVDKINSTGRWEAKVLDVLRSNASASTLVDGVVSASADGNGVVIYDVKLDTSAALRIAVCLSPKRDFDAPKGHIVKLQELKYGVNMGTAAADSVQIYVRKGSLETKIFSELSVDTTVTTPINYAGGHAFISAGPDEELIALVKDAATLADDSLNFVRVTGLIE